MDEVTRPDPDKVLARIKAIEDIALAGQEENAPGKLKIFFGYAAGVGKTYAMLEAARAAQAGGPGQPKLDVLAGYVEPHARPETLALLQDLPELPPLAVAYRGITLREFDLDAALARHPQIILVDELAHSNAEGCRNRKRHQDIEELLRAGISVWTTVNVQHIESLNDIVASITGVVVRERVPDSVFDRADQVELVDIEPDELITRLHLGKIYRERQAGQALTNFFQPDKLVALREIALRRMADRVNQRAEKRESAVCGQAYYTKEHILICLSGSPSNAKVIRTAARMCEAFHSDFTALFVETSDYASMDEDNRKRLQANLRLAEQLGAKIVTVYGDDVPAQIAEYAKIGAVSKIVIGRSNNKPSFFSQKKNLVEQLTELAPDIDSYIIPDRQPPFAGKRSGLLAGKTFLSWRDWAKTAAILALSSLIGLAFFHAGFGEANIITVYILGVLFIAMLTHGRFYGGAASLLSVFLFNFLFTEPRFTFQAYDSSYPVTFLVMFLASLLISSLTSRERGQAREAAGKAYRTEILLENSQKLQKADDAHTIMAETANQLGRLLTRSILFYPVQSQGQSKGQTQTQGRGLGQGQGQGETHGEGQGERLASPLYFPHPGERLPPDALMSADEQAVAQWVFKNNKRAGAGTDTLPGAKCLYLAVRGHSSALAVAALAPAEDGAPLEPMERNLVLALLSECALALEKERLNQENTSIAMQMQQEKLRANLLRAISHDLRTPLTAISGNASILMDEAAALDEAKKRNLYADIYDDAMWLINLVENLLSVTRIENGSMSIRMEAELMDEVIREALDRLKRQSAGHEIALSLEDELLMAKLDPRLIMQVIINLVDNALKYTAPGSRIGISVCRQKDVDKNGEIRNMIRVDVADNGEGIPNNEKERLFDMFHTADKYRGDGRRGFGLGLALCKSIVTAHGGSIQVRDNVPHGAIFSFTVQAEALPQ